MNPNSSRRTERERKRERYVINQVNKERGDKRNRSRSSWNRGRRAAGTGTEDRGVGTEGDEQQEQAQKVEELELRKTSSRNRSRR